MLVRFQQARTFFRAGFTLAEVLVSVAIVGVVFISLYLGICFSFSVTRSERESLRATQVILQRMEGIRLFNWNQVADTNLNPEVFYEQYLPASAGVTASGVTYTGRVEVVSATLDPPASYSASMRKVTVTVTWPSGNVLRSRSVSTYVAKDGVQNYIYSN
ncbi:MAG TPA: prepilin-type N-terminal cleavage/methylation domain-containing protein [Candidatus Paceibacterota bacterium]|nr:prepilin-type N-terminal cleavage/methylation domain-containing protein [Candidatus Paceibacterota bacterium]